MVSSLEKSERKRLGSVLSPTEISAVTTTRERFVVEHRRPPRRRTRRTVHQRVECLHAIERPHAERVCFQSIRRRLHRAGKIIHARETSGTTRARPCEPAAVSLPTRRHRARAEASVGGISEWAEASWL